MKRIGIVYATRGGQTGQIARHVANHLRTRNFEVEIFNVKESAPDLFFNPYDGLILAASVYLDRHERGMVKFVRNHLDALAACPTAFLSVSMSQAGVELPGIAPKQRAAHAANVDQILEKFYAETGWRPKYVSAVAGAVLYTKYNFLLRFIMKRISKKAGGSTDTSQDHEYTDWGALDRFSEKFASVVSAATQPVCAVSGGCHDTRG
jgi:menaquinone-dependent protoporphyrinogen oxidase